MNNKQCRKLKRKDLKIKNLVQFSLTILILGLIIYLSSVLYFRIDLTSEKRYTLTNATRNILRNLEQELFIQVYLEGEMPIGFKNMRRATKELLDEFRIYSGKKVIYEFINPAESHDQKVRNEVFRELDSKGLKATNALFSDKEGGRSQKIIFPGAIVNYNGMEMAVNLLKNNPLLNHSQNLHNSIEGLEYEFIHVIKNISSDTIYKVAFIEGHGELDEYQVGDITMELARFYHVDRGIIGGKPGILDDYAAVIVAKPREAFSEADKFVIDQYIMNGGGVLWLIDAVRVDWDSLEQTGVTVGLIEQINLDDQLFKYGVRINPKLIQDINCAIIPINIAFVGQQPKYVPAPWLYFPLLFPLENHPVTKNLNLIRSEFVNVIDTVGVEGRIKKKILLRSSKDTRVVSVPVFIRLEDIKDPPAEREFNKPFQSAAVLLEGEFESVFKNRMISQYIKNQDVDFRDHSIPNRMIIVADGDVIRNEVSVRADRIIPLTLGQDRYTQQTYGNKEFILNAVHYLAEETSLVEIRSRTLTLRLLDKTKIINEKFKWQLINTVLPVLILVLFGLVNRYFRKRKFA
ncbi:MAG: gliding motility-associated ABC transporter substrate-binding protein GldG [Bacteroidetes bacterium]|nr:gliding motility-associated ABC transporter substrate-binding protein GldG [Bacteroidota bacterium]